MTLLGQSIAMIVFVWFCMKFIWPPILAALEERHDDEQLRLGGIPRTNYYAAGLYFHDVDHSLFKPGIGNALNIYTLHFNKLDLILPRRY